MPTLVFRRASANAAVVRMARLSDTVAQALSIDEVNQLGRDTGHATRLLTITPHRLFLALVSTPGQRPGRIAGRPPAGFPISDVLQPCQMVKDYPGKVPIGDVPQELDGDIDAVVKTHLLRKASGTPGAPAAESDDV
jgi:hypothetical protein